MVGRLDGFLDGRPLSLVVEDRSVTLNSDSFATLLKLRRSWRSMLQPLLSILDHEQIGLFVNVRWLGKIEMFPKPNYLVRLLLT
jgi:hypothetical protein